MRHATHDAMTLRQMGDGEGLQTEIPQSRAKGTELGDGKTANFLCAQTGTKFREDFGCQGGSL